MTASLYGKATDKNLGQVLIWDVGELGAVELGNHELEKSRVRSVLTNL